MARNRKPRKKYQKNAKANLAYLNGIVLQSWESYPLDAEGEPIYRSNRPFSVVQEAAFKQRRWYIEAIVRCIAPGGEGYEEAETFLTEPILLNDIQDEIIAAVDRVKLEVNHNHIVDWGWRARPVTKKLLQEIRIEDALAA